MVSLTTIRHSITFGERFRRWVSRAFLVTIAAYLLVLGFLLYESVTGASKWAPYGVNMPLFVFLIIASEVAITATAVWIFKEDAGIWPASVTEGWRRFKQGERWRGFKQILGGAWDISIVDLRLRTQKAIWMGRANRMAALAPLVYALVASAGNAPWAVQSSALIDIVLTMVVWAFMEIVMVRPESRVAHADAGTSASAAGVAPMGAVVAPRVVEAPQVGVRAGSSVRAAKESRYEVRRVEARDLERVLDIENIKWGEQAAGMEKVLSRMAIFPEGQLAAVHISTANGREVRRSVVAWATIMPANRAQVRSFRSWDRVTSHGTIRDADRKGDVMVGVNLTSVTEGATYVLLGEILASVVEWGKSRLIGGSRLNGFVAFNDQRRREGKWPVTADEYARLREMRGYRLNEARLDAGLPPFTDEEYRVAVDDLRWLNSAAPLEDEEAPDYVCSNLRGYMSIPGTRMVEVVPGYFADEASDDYGVVIEWPNPLPAALRWFGPAKSFVAGRIRSEIQSEWEARKRRVREVSARRRAARVAAEISVAETVEVVVSR